jgi:uncharacterized membrane protein
MPTKSIFTSVTFYGAVISLLGIVAPKISTALGITTANSAAIAQEAVAVVGFLITLWGRVRATTKVTLTGK